MPVLGIEPARNVAAAARRAACRRSTEFFGRDLAERLVRERGHADLVIGNNVLAQVPDLNDFVAGIATLLAPDGVATLEFPHVVRLVEGSPVRHDLPRALLVLLADHRRPVSRPPTGWTVVDVEELSTHGGSLRVFLARADGHPTVDAGGGRPPRAQSETAATRASRGTRASSSACARQSDPC